MDKFLIIGTKPPPRGGVAVYLQRKVDYLRSKNQYVEWVNPRRIIVFAWKLLTLHFRQKPEVVELHSAHKIALFLACLLHVEARITFFDHNYSATFAQRRGLSLFILKRFLNRAKMIVLVQKHLTRNYTGLLSPEALERVSIETPYIPISASMKGREHQLPPIILNFVQRFPVVVVNAAWKLVDDSEGRDLYGIRWSLESFLKRFGNHAQVGFVAITGSQDQKRFGELLEIGRGKDNVLIVSGDYDLLSVLAASQSILLRTTSTDGDSLSVREALELDRPVIASNAVERPLGALTYKYGDREDFEKKLDSQIGNLLGGRTCA